MKTVVDCLIIVALGEKMNELKIKRDKQDKRDKC